MNLTMFQKIAIGIGIAFVLLLLVGGGVLFYFVDKNHNDSQITAMTNAAYAKGEADANSKTIQATNAQLVQAIQNLQNLQAATNNKLANIRVTAQVEQQKIDSYVVDPTHPADAEKWANDTSTQLLSAIQSDANTDPTTMPLQMKPPIIISPAPVSK